MIKQIKNFTLNLIAGANVVTVALMLLAGYSDRLYPPDYPHLCWVGMIFPFFLVANLLFLFLWLILSWKRALIPIAGFFFAYVPISIYMPINMQEAPPEGSLKVLSYNVCGYGGNYKYENGFDTVYNYIRYHDFDIVCLQEDIDTWREYVMSRWKKVFEYNDTTILYQSSTSMNCIGIHTRFPILRKERIDYKSVANGSVAYYLLVGSDTVLVINNHLEGTHLNEAERSRYKEMLGGKMVRDTIKAETRFLVSKLSTWMVERAPQADAVHDYIERHRQYPIIVCGDFNDTPISYTRHTIAQGLTDCFTTTGRGFGLSYNQKGFNFRIDQIMCSHHFTPYKCFVDSKMDASDHYPMICSLKMKDKP